MSTFCEIQSVHSVLNLKISLFDTFYVLCEIQSVHSVLGTLKISLFDTFYVLCKTGLTTGKASMFFLWWRGDVLLDAVFERPQRGLS
jgi:hypothetical protein